MSLEKVKRTGKMGVTKWEGVVVGYPATSVGYRVWDPVRGKVFNVGVPLSTRMSGRGGGEILLVEG